MILTKLVHIFIPGIYLVKATETNHIHRSRHVLLDRQVIPDFCFTGGTCAECFGEGWETCEGNTCFNPSRHQCCAGGKYCVGDDPACCPDGPGATGTTPTPTADPDSPSTTIPSPLASVIAASCTQGDTYDDCCQSRGDGYAFCGLPNPYDIIFCYVPSFHVCCDNGIACSRTAPGPECCEVLMDAVPTTPTEGSATVSDGIPSSSTAMNSASPSNSVTVSGMSSSSQPGTASESASSTASEPQETGAAPEQARRGLAAIAAGVLGLALI